jgi:hypothetical protein
MTTASTRPSPPTTVMAPDGTVPAILAVIQGYGYKENEGIVRRHQRALALVLQGHFTAKDLTPNAHSLPVVTRFHVGSGSGGGHYHVTKTPNQPDSYDCTCPDRFLPATCKHRYGAALIQDALTLTHLHRLDILAYRRTLQTLHAAPLSHPFGSHELAALQVLLNTTEIYDALAQEAARQHYGANRSYASTCFSAMLDKARWAYGAGYVGWTDNDIGELHSVLAGRPVIQIRWDDRELRWYVVGTDGAEDQDTTATLLRATCPSWGSFLQAEANPLPETTFEQEEEPDGHYALDFVPHTSTLHGSTL